MMKQCQLNVVYIPGSALTVGICWIEIFAFCHDANEIERVSLYSAKSETPR